MRASVNYFFENTPFRLKKKTIVSSWVKSIVISEKKFPGAICFIFCNDKYLLDINTQFLKRKTLTDVIAFDYSEGDFVSGDIYISVDRVEENAKKLSIAFFNELYRVMAHGVLHLTGYTDKDKAKRLVMTAKENIHIVNIYKIIK